MVHISSLWQHFFVLLPSHLFYFWVSLFSKYPWKNNILFCLTFVVYSWLIQWEKFIYLTRLYVGQMIHEYPFKPGSHNMIRVSEKLARIDRSGVITLREASVAGLRALFIDNMRREQRNSRWPSSAVFVCSFIHRHRFPKGLSLWL